LMLNEPLIGSVTLFSTRLYVAGPAHNTLTIRVGGRVTGVTI